MMNASLLLAALVSTVNVCGARDRDTGTIRGQVLSLLGDPLEGAEVTVLEDSGTLCSVTADAAGFYRLDAVPEGRYQLVVRMAGFAEERRPVRVPDGGDVLVDFGLAVGKLVELPSSLSGIVLSDLGPLEGATVVAMAALNVEIRAEAKTGSDGRFVLSLEDPGLFVVYAYKPGFAVATEGLVIWPTLPRPHLNLRLSVHPLPRP